MARLFHLTSLVALATTLIAVIYFTWVIYSAREYTANTVIPRYHATQYPLAVSDLSPRQIEIPLQVEDPRFFEHSGADLTTPGAGITTITQALVKHLYFEKFRPGVAKLKQTAIAKFALDPLMPKSEQLRLFINTAYLGPNANGFAQASETFFARPLANLTEAEYIALVATMIAPASFGATSATVSASNGSSRSLAASTFLAVSSMSSTASSTRTFGKTSLPSPTSSLTTNEPVIEA